MAIRKAKLQDILSLTNGENVDSEYFFNKNNGDVSKIMINVLKVGDILDGHIILDGPNYTLTYNGNSLVPLTEQYRNCLLPYMFTVKQKEQAIVLYIDNFAELLAKHGYYDNIDGIWEFSNGDEPMYEYDYAPSSNLYSYRGTFSNWVSGTPSEWKSMMDRYRISSYPICLLNLESWDVIAESNTDGLYDYLYELANEGIPGEYHVNWPISVGPNPDPEPTIKTVSIPLYYKEYNVSEEYGQIDSVFNFNIESNYMNVNNPYHIVGGYGHGGDNNLHYLGDAVINYTGNTPVLTVRVQTNDIDTTDCAVTVRLREYYGNKYTDLSETYTWCDNVNGSDNTYFVNQKFNLSTSLYTDPNYRLELAFNY
jgi:hypothetical protein